MEIEIKGCAVRILREEGSGHAEVSVTKASPPINFSTFLDAGSDVESGTYDLILKKSAGATELKPKATATEEATDGKV